ncbi:MAG TPA: glycoside hydrolase family 2 TIM barrel-domain containing protein, partial [Opitutales bacterium]|nr:glycoside hydrolase family 2 TIM barrel-domain containing protein [Opitutales bacterium]
AAGGFLATFDPVPPCQGDRDIPRERARSLNGTGWTCDGMPVTVPHNWNIGDGADGLDVPKEKRGHRSVSSPSYERKKVCYARALPDPVKGRRTFVKCEGASVKAEMRVNGKVAGRHAGAYTAFCFEVTDLLKPSGNRLEIDVDNAYDPDLPPNEADFTAYGGLYRNVWLIETPRVCIDPTVDGGPGLAIDADPDTGRVTARVAVSGGTNEVQTFEFANPKLWSPETPDLYALTVKIRQGGCEDEVTETFGFRKTEFRQDGFYLNGRKRQIHGVCRHQDRLGKGWAVSAADEAEDVRWMKKMGADGVRTSHYPDSPAFYDLCDRNGLLVWTEIPVVDDVPPTEAFKANAIRMAREMVTQHRNHPSVIVWGIFNEVYQYRKQDGSAEKTLTPVRDCIRALDPSRPVGGASNGNKLGLNAVPDVLGMNLYPGWYGAAADKMGELIAKACEANKRSAVAVTEYGGGASVNQHADATYRPKTTDRFHPEEYQAYLHHGNYAGIRDNPRVWGSFAWVMFDLASDSRQEGEFAGINDKGLVTGDRRTAKDTFYLYKANWNPEPELHLVGERMTSTTNATKTVVVFANTDDVWLRVNGRVIGMKHPDAVKTCVWPDVPLDPGPNEIDLRGGPFAKTGILIIRTVGNRTP